MKRNSPIRRARNVRRHNQQSKHQPWQPGNFESLEARQLLATINVGSFGAVANDGRDDRSAIIAAINASAPGDTILFNSGTYNLSDQVFLKGANRTYKGQGTTLHGNDTSRHIFHIQEDNVRVEGFTFNGKPIMIDRVSSTGSGVMNW